VTFKDLKAMTARFGRATEAFTVKRYVKVKLQDQAAPSARLTAKFRAGGRRWRTHDPAAVISR
jgi:hypothetical protein